MASADETIRSLETCAKGHPVDAQTIFSKIKFNEQGLIPAIAQQYDTKEVLMMAWMNEESLRETLETGRVCYYSRSRNKLWRKGEQSGQVQVLKSFVLDCDVDTVLVVVDQTGPACHTGRRTCFYIEATENGAFTINAEPLISPDELYK